MAETAAAATAAPAAPAKKAVAKKPKVAPTHPKVSSMVESAITALKERKGSSVAAIKKHIVANNKVNADKIRPFIVRYIKKAVTAGTLVQTKGSGANGSFKLAVAVKDAKPKAPKKKKAATTPKKSATKKTATPKKKKAAVKKTATKSKKEKKTAKSPKKPKAPKPKKAASKPKAKKATPKKK